MNDLTNTIFQKAVSFVAQTNRHLFLTGKAGTGKTTFLKYIKENSFKKMAVIAPTGVAAVNAGGVTIHSFFQLPFGMFLPTHQTVWGDLNSNIYNKNRLLSNLKLNSAKLDLIRELELLVIDEISMVRADLLDAIDTVLRSVRRQHSVPFGGVQMLFIGDLFQLPPVVRDEEMALLAEHYDSPFFFNAQCIREAPPVYLELKKIYRQSDLDFIQLLNNIRNNRCTGDDMELLYKYYDPGFTPDRKLGYITLTSHNNRAEAINRAELDRLEGRTYNFDAEVKGDFNENAYPVEKSLKLKLGSQIMFIKNDKGEPRRYYNGKIGVIEKIDEHNNKIVVSFPTDEPSIELTKETWQNIRYKYDQEKDSVKEEELGSFTQYPIRLAWAITIHKSQGLTFEKAIIDAGASFAPGQVYVALSRLTSLKGLVLKSQIHPSSISTDSRVIDFTNEELSEDQLQATLEEEQKAYVARTLLDTFNWGKIVEKVDTHYDAYSTRAIAEKDKAMAWGKALKETAKRQYSVSAKFCQQLELMLVQGEAIGYEHLHNRTKAASDWFAKDMAENMDIKTHIDEVKIKTKTKKYVRELQELQVVIDRKKQQVQQSALITEGLYQSLNLTEVMGRVQEMNKPIVITIKEEITAGEGKPLKSDTARTSLKLYKEGKTIAQIAAARNMAQSTIEGHLGDFVATGEVPITALVTMDKLEHIIALLKKQPNIAATAIREQLGNDYMFSEIKAAVKYFQGNKE